MSKRRRPWFDCFFGPAQEQLPPGARHSERDDRFHLTVLSTIPKKLAHVCIEAANCTIHELLLISGCNIYTKRWLPAAQVLRLSKFMYTFAAVCPDGRKSALIPVLSKSTCFSVAILPYAGQACSCSNCRRKAEKLFQTLRHAVIADVPLNTLRLLHVPAGIEAASMELSSPSTAINGGCIVSKHIFKKHQAAVQMATEQPNVGEISAPGDVDTLSGFKSLFYQMRASWNAQPVAPVQSGVVERYTQTLVRAVCALHSMQQTVGKRERETIHDVEPIPDADITNIDSLSSTLSASVTQLAQARRLGMSLASIQMSLDITQSVLSACLPFMTGIDAEKLRGIIPPSPKALQRTFNAEQGLQVYHACGHGLGCTVFGPHWPDAVECGKPIINKNSAQAVVAPCPHTSESATCMVVTAGLWQAVHSTIVPFAEPMAAKFRSESPRCDVEPGGMICPALFQSSPSPVAAPPGTTAPCCQVLTPSGILQSLMRPTIGTVDGELAVTTVCTGCNATFAVCLAIKCSHCSEVLDPQKVMAAAGGIPIINGDGKPIDSPAPPTPQRVFRVECSKCSTMSNDLSWDDICPTAFERLLSAIGCPSLEPKVYFRFAFSFPDNIGVEYISAHDGMQEFRSSQANTTTVYTSAIRSTFSGREAVVAFGGNLRADHFKDTVQRFSNASVEVIMPQITAALFAAIQVIGLVVETEPGKEALFVPRFVYHVGDAPARAASGGGRGYCGGKHHAQLEISPNLLYYPSKPGNTHKYRPWSAFSVPARPALLSEGKRRKQLAQFRSESMHIVEEASVGPIKCRQVLTALLDLRGQFELQGPVPIAKLRGVSITRGSVVCISHSLSTIWRNFAQFCYDQWAACVDRGGSLTQPALHFEFANCIRSFDSSDQTDSLAGMGAILDQKLDGPGNSRFHTPKMHQSCRLGSLQYLSIVWYFLCNGAGWSSSVATYSGSWGLLVGLHLLELGFRCLYQDVAGLHFRKSLGPLPARQQYEATVGADADAAMYAAAHAIWASCSFQSPDALLFKSVCTNVLAAVLQAIENQLPLKSFSSNWLESLQRVAVKKCSNNKRNLQTALTGYAKAANTSKGAELKRLQYVVSDREAEDLQHAPSSELIADRTDTNRDKQRLTQPTSVLTTSIKKAEARFMHLNGLPDGPYQPAAICTGVLFGQSELQSFHFEIPAVWDVVEQRMKQSQRPDEVGSASNANARVSYKNLSACVTSCGVVKVGSCVSIAKDSGMPTAMLVRSIVARIQDVCFVGEELIAQSVEIFLRGEIYTERTKDTNFPVAWAMGRIVEEASALQHCAKYMISHFDSMDGRRREFELNQLRVSARSCWALNILSPQLGQNSLCWTPDCANLPCGRRLQAADFVLPQFPLVGEYFQAQHHSGRKFASRRGALQTDASGSGVAVARVVALATGQTGWQLLQEACDLLNAVSGNINVDTSAGALNEFVLSRDTSCSQPGRAVGQGYGPAQDAIPRRVGREKREELEMRAAERKTMHSVATKNFASMVNSDAQAARVFVQERVHQQFMATCQGETYILAKLLPICKDSGQSSAGADATHQRSGEENASKIPDLGIWEQFAVAETDIAGAVAVIGCNSSSLGTSGYSTAPFCVLNALDCTRLLAESELTSGNVVTASTSSMPESTLNLKTFFEECPVDLQRHLLERHRSAENDALAPYASLLNWPGMQTALELDEESHITGLDLVSNWLSEFEMIGQPWLASKWHRQAGPHGNEVLLLPLNVET